MFVPVRAAEPSWTAFGRSAFGWKRRENFTPRSDCCVCERFDSSNYLTISDSTRDGVKRMNGLLLTPDRLLMLGRPLEGDGIAAAGGLTGASVSSSLIGS